jgi:peptide/nickel transport system ATP-binding protein
LRHERCEERPVLSIGSAGADVGSGADAHRDACWLPDDDRASLRLTSRSAATDVPDLEREATP